MHVHVEAERQEGLSRPRGAASPPWGKDEGRRRERLLLAARHEMLALESVAGGLNSRREMLFITVSNTFFRRFYGFNSRLILKHCVATDLLDC